MKSFVSSIVYLMAAAGVLLGIGMLFELSWQITLLFCMVAIGFVVTIKSAYFLFGHLLFKDTLEKPKGKEFEAEAKRRRDARKKNRWRD